MRTQDPGFWDDAKRAEIQMKKVKDLKKWIQLYNEVHAAVEELRLAFDYVKEEIVSEEEVDTAYSKALALVENLEFRNMLREEADSMSCVLKINSGAGGTESQDWASMLMRMYLRWAEANNYKVSIANLQEGDEAGIKTVTINIEGDYAYGYLKSENGVHRLVRVSPYNAQGKRMTSFASVFVTPLVDDTIEVKIDPAAISWDTFRSGGAGISGKRKNVETADRRIPDQSPHHRQDAESALRAQLFPESCRHRLRTAQGHCSSPEERMKGRNAVASPWQRMRACPYGRI